MAEGPDLGQIRQMKQRGMSNTQILSDLQDQGYSSSQVLDALGSRQPPPPGPLSMPPPAPATPPPDSEELIEAMIDEKWNDLMSDINKVIAWKEATESRIVRLDQQLTDLKDQFDKVHQALVGKIGEYDQHILDVGAEVKAMEKVFSKVLPVFTDNVAELSRVTERFRKKK